MWVRLVPGLAGAAVIAAFEGGAPLGVPVVGPVACAIAGMEIDRKMAPKPDVKTAKWIIVAAPARSIVET